MTTLLGLKNCDSCKKAMRWLERFGIPFEFVDYRDQRPEPETLTQWAEWAGGFDALVNKSSMTWRKLPDSRKQPGTEAEWKLLLREQPTLIRRPVLLTEDSQFSQGFSDNLFKKRFGLE